ncbi:MAG: dihydropteroate synthase [Promethearchaeota archaeon]
MPYIQHEIFSGYELGDFSPVQIMGIINLSPESFYASSFIPKEDILLKIKDFMVNGAKMIDLGARSTAPWSEKITVEEERKRIEAALNLLPGQIPAKTVLSIDTQYAEIAEVGLQFGIDHGFHIIINDISSFKTDPRMMQVVVKHNCPVVLMASKEVPGDAKSVDDIISAFSSTLDALKSASYDIQNAIIDPGIGKWVKDKTYEYDVAMLDQLEAFRCFGIPILVGLSRKSFLGAILGEKEAKNRGIGSLAATSIAVYNGAHIIRTHDVNKSMLQTIQTASAIRRKPFQIQDLAQICEMVTPIRNLNSASQILLAQGVTHAGAKIMSQKILHYTIYLQNITAPQGLILKQEMLARGGEVTLHKEVVTTEHAKHIEKFDAYLTGTHLQFKKLVKKLKGQDLGIDHVGTMINTLLSKQHETKEIYNKDYPTQKINGE